jgi:hypothetical protein
VGLFPFPGNVNLSISRNSAKGEVQELVISIMIRLEASGVRVIANMLLPQPANRPFALCGGLPDFLPQLPLALQPPGPDSRSAGRGQVIRKLAAYLFLMDFAALFEYDVINQFQALAAAVTGLPVKHARIGVLLSLHILLCLKPGNRLIVTRQLNFPTVFPTSEIIIGVQNGMSKGKAGTDFILYSMGFKTRREKLVNDLGRVVAPVVAGSRPVAHPIKLKGLG